MATATNSKSVRVRTAKAGKCQWCETKTPLENQERVYNDLEKGVVVRERIGKRAAPTVIEEGLSHWCGDCADKRVAMATRWLDSRGSTAKPKAKKASGRKSGAQKASASKKTAKRATAKKATAKKRVVKKRSKAQPAGVSKASEVF